MTPAHVSTAPSLAAQAAANDLTPGQRVHVIGWVYYAYQLHAVYAEADGYVRTVPADLIRIEPNDQSEDKAA